MILRNLTPNEGVKEEKLERTAFKHQSLEHASNTVTFWRSQTDPYKLKCAYHLPIRAYGFDPENEPVLDRTVFFTRKR